MASRLVFTRKIPLHAIATTWRFSSRARLLSDATGSIRRNVSKEERMALRSARRERANQRLQEELKATEGTSGATPLSSTRLGGQQVLASRWVWYLGVGIPSALLVWGLNDENSPPARFSEFVGLTGLITSYTDQIAKPTHEKLLPDWSQVSSGVATKLCTTSTIR